MSNKVSIAEDELLDYLIDGIPDTNMQDQARMQQFESISDLLDAFKNINLKYSMKKNTISQKRFDSIAGVSSRSSGIIKPTLGVRCYNCNMEGHLATSCPSPKREKSSCFMCRSLGHQY